jgi:hypothetical protein
MSPSARHVSTSNAGEPDEQRREFHDCAGRSVELIEAAAWYDDIRLGLGTEFLDAIQHVFARVATEPRLYATLEYSTASRREVRRYCLRRFPYVIVYWIEGDIAWLKTKGQVYQVVDAA